MGTIFGSFGPESISQINTIRKMFPGVQILGGEHAQAKEFNDLSAQLQTCLKRDFSEKTKGLFVVQEGGILFTLLEGAALNRRGLYSTLVQIAAMEGPGQEFAIRANVNMHIFEDQSSLLLELSRASTNRADLSMFFVDLKGQIEDYIRELSTETIRQFRRQLPLTKTKIDWSRLTEHGMVAGLKNVSS